MRVKHKLFEHMRLKEIELGRQITITEVSNESGISRVTLHAWLHDAYLNRFEANTVSKLCEYFGCDIGDLLVIEE